MEVITVAMYDLENIFTEEEYRGLIQSCNHLKLNISQTNELMVDCCCMSVSVYVFQIPCLCSHAWPIKPILMKLKNVSHTCLTRQHRGS